MDIRGDTGPRPEVMQPADSIAMPLNPQMGIVPAPRDWSLWLLPLVVLMLLAGEVAIYFIPTNPDMLLPLSFWLLLATALFAVVAWRTTPLLASSLNDAVRHKPNGEPITWNPFASLLSLLLAIFIATVLATGGMFGFALNRPSFYVVYDEVERPLVLLVTSAVIIILLLFIWLAPIWPLQKLLQLRLAGVGILIIPVAIYLALNAWLPSVLLRPFDNTGPFASWPAILQFAQHEADRIDKDAIIYDVYVLSYPVDGAYSPQTSPFAMELRFVRPTGEGISIELLDTNPIRLIYVDKEGGALVSSYEYAHDRSADWLAYIKLGPREVYSLTEKEAIAFAQGNGINVAEFRPSPQISLLYDGVGSSQYGVTAVWDMEYLSKYGLESLDLYIDSATGAVLNRRSYLMENTATPTPPPPATASPVP